MLTTHNQMNAKIPIRVNPPTAEDRDRIKAELGVILATDHFASSKRYPAFLTYIVEKTLDGRSDELKERTIAIEVFKRKADFDPGADTVVRFTAGEVRKRLNSIYSANGRTAEVQIELLVGSYVPEFFRLAVVHDEVNLRVSADNFGTESIPATSPPPPSKTVGNLRGKLLLASLACVILVFLGFLRFRLRPAPTSLERFWQPIRAGSEPIICPGAFVISMDVPNSQEAPNPDKRLAATKNDAYPYTSMATVEAIASVTTVLTQQHEGYILQHAGAVSLSDMRQHPLVLIGGYDNEWTLRLTENLRFRFSKSPRFQIYDATKPSDLWTRSMANVNYGDADDYAIVARMRDKLTENTVVMIAGISKNGTVSASQFVTSSRYLDVLDRPPTKDWAQKNLEIVLKTNVIEGKIGPPTIERVYLW